MHSRSKSFFFFNLRTCTGTPVVREKLFESEFFCVVSQDIFRADLISPLLSEEVLVVKFAEVALPSVYTFCLAKFLLDKFCIIRCLVL